MSDEIKMSVSLLSTSGDKRVVYVAFSDGDKSSEFVLPEAELVKNSGFSEEEIGQLTDYIKSELGEIYKIAGNINPIKNFMKEKI